MVLLTLFKLIIVFLHETSHALACKLTCVQVGEAVERMPCQFYLNPVGCWYGNACKFAHYPERFDMPQTRPSVLSFPIRLEDIECPYYTFLGSCERSDICRFQQPPLPTSQADQSALSESRALPLGVRSEGLQISNEPVSSSGVSGSQMLLLPHQMLHKKGAQDLVVSTSSSSKSYAGLFARVPTPTKSEGTVSQQANTKEYPKGQEQINFPVSSSSSSSKDNVRQTARAPTSTKSDNTINQQANTEEHPKCQVQFNHLNARPISAPLVAVSPMGLPLRPNQPVCTFYSRYGLCINGIGCQHDHPVGYGTAAAQSSNQTPGPSDNGNNANQ